MSNTHVLTVFGCFVIILCCPGGGAYGQVALYDNLDRVRSEADWHTANGPDRRHAQQFLIGESTNIDQVTVKLQRPQSSVRGSLRFELWRDNGAGKPIPVTDPTGKIADLGKIIDVTQIPLGKFAEYTFDNLILGLEPNVPYWVVSDWAEVSGIRGGAQSVGFAAIYGGDPQIPDPPDYDATAGTRGAAHLHAYRNQDPFWADLNEVFGLEHLYKAMKVEAMGNAAVTPSLVQVGDPVWTVGDTHHFSGPASSEAEWRETVDTVSPPSTHCTPRDLPHDSLWADAITDSGFDEATTFVPSSIDAKPNAVFTTLRLLPDPGETGSSLDAESGPIISTDLLPIHATWSWTRDGETVDEGFSSDFARPDCLVNGVDGLSSFQQISSTDASLFAAGTELVGSYQTQVQIRDNNGNGWNVAIPFEVVEDLEGDISFDGHLDTTDIDILSSAVRQALADPQYDVNNDSQVDTLDRTTWVHDLANTYFGDSNLDGEFNSTDLTTVFQAGEYEDNITLNSTWAEGDWNGDGDFDSGDLITAFQDGGYESGPRAAVTAVPEPSSWMLVALGLLSVGRIHRR